MTRSRSQAPRPWMNQGLGWSRTMQLFSREKQKTKAIEPEAELQPLDPIALCLAVWLGMMVCAFGLVRAMDHAAQRNADADRLTASAQAMRPVAPIP